MILHKTSPRWEAGEIPSRELIARVGALLGELAQAGVLQAGEGLRASSEGVRLRFSGGTCTLTPGPFQGEREDPAGFSIVRAGSLDEAVQWVTRQASALGDGTCDIRPVTEAWDIGMAPKPEGLSTRRYMALRKERAPLRPFRGEALTSESLKPSARGRRYKNSRDGVTVTDGPFAESKELIAGYVIVSAASLDEAGRWAERYLAAVEADEVDVRELE